MLNKEKYAKELVEIACDPERVALDKQNNRIQLQVLCQRRQ